MIKIDRLLTNITELSQTFDEKKNEDMDNLDDLNNKLITLKTKNDSVDDKLIEIEKNIKLIYDRIDIIDDKLDSVDLRIGTLNGNLNTLLKALQKK
jgi:septal ring factor EnvC (AmiA/AmiB activator)